MRGGGGVVGGRLQLPRGGGHQGAGGGGAAGGGGRGEGRGEVVMVMAPVHCSHTVHHRTTLSTVTRHQGSQQQCHSISTSYIDMMETIF